MHPKAQVVVGYFVDKDVVIEGLAVFRPSGRLLRIDADAIDAAGSRDWYFSTLPRPGVADYAAAARARPGSSPYQELLEEITAMEARVEEIKARKKQTQHPIDWAQLDEADRFERPVLGRKRLLDAVHMIAYRAETALCSLLRSATIDNAAARRLLQDLFVMDADIRPDPSAGLLHVEIHRGSRPVVDRTLAALIEQLNEMEITFPDTELVLRYSLLGDSAPDSP